MSNRFAIELEIVKPPDQGYRDLAASVIQSALSDANRTNIAAYDWLMASPYFEFWCSFLDIDAGQARVRIRERYGWAVEARRSAAAKSKAAKPKHFVPERAAA